MAYVRTLCEHEDPLLELFLTWKDTAWSRSSELACLLLRSGGKACKGNVPKMAVAHT